MGTSQSSRSRWGFVGVVILASLLCVWLGWRSWLGGKTNSVRPAVRAAVEAVLKAQLKGRITGSYWENEMEDQARLVSRLPERDRLDFYLAIMLYCDLNDSRATLFCELAANDAEALRQDLLHFMNTANFQTLTARQHENVENWIVELQIVASQHSAAASPLQR